MNIHHLIKHILICILLFTVVKVNAKNSITFVIEKIPQYTPINEELYFSSSVDNWSVVDSTNKFKLFPDGLYRLTIDVSEKKVIEYKINRGSWRTVEGNKWGGFMPNRELVINDSIYEVKLEVASWQDLHHQFFPPIEIIVNEIPKNTPKDASIYITGNFNNWIDNDETYRLKRTTDGTYVTKIPPGFETIKYKFLRGGWETIECRWDGGILSNRMFSAEQGDGSKIYAKINGWSDLSNNLLFLRVLFLTFVLQSIIIAGLMIRNKKNALVIAFVSIIGVGFFLKFFYLFHEMLSFFPKGYLFPALLYVAIFSISYVIFKSMINKNSFEIKLLNVLPGLLLLWYFSLLVVPSSEFYLNIINNEYAQVYYMFYGIAIVLHQINVFRLKALFDKSEQTLTQKVKLLFVGYQYLSWFSLIVAATAVLLYIQGVDVKFVFDLFENLLWISIGVSLLYYQWFILFKASAHAIKNEKTKSKESGSEEYWLKLKDKLVELMEKDKVYLNPDLTLSDLASYLITNNQYVSRVINKSFGKSYTDFVNEYRVNDFIELVKKDTYNETFLFYATKVGFNSKSAFNRAFKKNKNKTPREYFASAETAVSC